MNCTPFGSATEQELAAFEQQTGLGLPASYREFLLDTNSAAALNQSFFVRDLDQEIKLQVLFGLYNTASRGLTLTCWLAEYKEELGPDTLLIGKDRGGIFCSIRWPVRSKVFTTGIFGVSSHSRLMGVGIPTL
jgi:hypothetical protein